MTVTRARAVDVRQPQPYDARRHERRGQPAPRSRLPGSPPGAPLSYRHLSTSTRIGRVRCRVWCRLRPLQATRIPSSTASSCGLSPRCPAVTTIDSTLLVSPGRRPVGDE